MILLKRKPWLRENLSQGKNTNDEKKIIVLKQHANLINIIQIAKCF
jgi:hypothetical protein